MEHPYDFKRILRIVVATSGFVLGISPSVLAESHLGQTGPISLEKAIELALIADPLLAASDFASSAAKSRSNQARAFPNPEIILELENFGGEGDFRGTRQAELTGVLSQRIELGGKRRHRMDAANFETQAASAEMEVTKRLVVARTTSDFYGLLGAKAQLAIAEEKASNAQRLLPALKRRVEAGASPQVELSRGQVAFDLARIERDQAQNALQVAKSHLASNWQGSGVEIEIITGKLPQNQRPKIEFEKLADALADHPRLKSSVASKSKASADYRSEKAQRIPDLTLGVGARQIRETDDTVLLFSATLPIPVWDRNSGAVEAKRQLAAKSEADQQVVERNLYRQLSSAYGALVSACDETRRLNQTIVPSATRNLQELEDGYAQGRFGVLELLDATSVLADARNREITSLVECSSSAAEVEYLTGLNPFTGRPVAQSSEVDQ